MKIKPTRNPRALLVLLLLTLASLGSAQGYLICRLKSATNPAAVAATYQLLLADSAGPSPFVLYWVGPGRDLEYVEHLLESDARVCWAEADRDMEAPETTGAGSGNTIGAVGDWGALFQLNKTMLLQVSYTPLYNQSKGNVRVAILDNGLSPRQPRLWKNVVASANLLPDGRMPFDLPYQTDTDQDGYVDRMVGHGTMVAGLVDLLAPSARLVIARVADSDGIATSWSLIKGVAYAVQNGCQLCNISLGSMNEIPAFEDVVDWAESNKMLIVAPIGNDEVGRSIYPARFEKVVCVSGLLPSSIKAPFSNWDSTADVAAPATGIMSTWWDGTFGIWSGTSFAAPMVTGSLANALRAGYASTPGQLRQMLRGSGDNIDALNPDYRSKLGTRLNMSRLLSRLKK